MTLLKPFSRLAAAVLVALAASVQAEPLKEIRIAVPDLSAGTQHSGGGYSDVIREQQWLEKAFAADGVTIQWNYFKGAGPVINEALANGQVDLAYLGDLAAIVGKANGLDTRLLSATGRGIKHYLGVPPGSDIHTLADLKGKRVAVFRGTASQLSFDAALASQGLSERDVKVINLDYAAASAALAAKRIDASWGLTNMTTLQSKGLAQLPLNTRDLGGAGSIQAVLIGNGAFVDAHPDAIKKVLAVQSQAAAWLADEKNRQAYIDLVARQASYPAAIIAGDLNGESLATYFASSLDPKFLADLQASVDLAADQKLIRKGFKVSDWLYHSPQAVAGRE